MNEKTARWLLGLGIPIVLAAIGLVPYALAWSSFPDRVASHFTSSGVADGSMSPGEFLGVNGILFFVGVVLCLFVAMVRRPLAAMVVMGLAVTGAFLAAIPAGVLLTTAATQRDLEDWRDASGGVFPLLFAVFGLGLVAAVAAGRLGALLPAKEPEIDSTARPVMVLAVEEQAVWHGGLRWVLGVWLGLFIVLMAFVIGYATGQWFSFVVMLVCAVPILALSSIRVRVDRFGLQVNYGFLPWPRTRISTAEIESAAVIDVRPKQWGGWGYRGSLTIMKQAAVVLRAGPGIRLDLRNGKVFVVTVDDPETAVSLLNAEIHRHTPASV